MVTPDAKRDAVAHAREQYGLSERRACQLVGITRRVARYVELPKPATNIDALARATGIPRESVRRKVNELIAEGLVRRDEENRLGIAAGAAARLAPSTEVTIHMLDNLIATYLAMMSDLQVLRSERLLQLDVRGSPH